MSSALAGLPPLGRERPSGFGAAASQVASQAARAGVAGTGATGQPRIKVLKLGIRKGQAPVLGLMYEHLRDQKRRFIKFQLRFTGAESSASVARDLAREYPKYLGEELVDLQQLTALVEMVNPSAAAKPSADTAGTEDLNRVPEEVLKLHKERMEADFSQNQLKPGDLGYEYDRRVDFDSTGGNEPNDWDIDEDDMEDSFDNGSSDDEEDDNDVMF